MSSATIDETETVAGPAVAKTPRPGFKPFRVTVDRFNRMIAAGVLGEDAPVILWKGGLVETMTKGDNHSNACVALSTLFIRMVPQEFHVRSEQPILIPDDGRPEPDLTVVRGAFRDYKGRIPSIQDVSLIVEVADSSLALDSGEILEAYAARSVPVYWIVNLPKRRVEVYREPSGPSGAAGYRQCQQFVAGDTVPVVLDGIEVGRVAVDDILP